MPQCEHCESADTEYDWFWHAWLCPTCLLEAQEEHEHLVARAEWEREQKRAEVRILVEREPQWR